jgi:hypothetical protein
MLLNELNRFLIANSLKGFVTKGVFDVAIMKVALKS